MEGKTIDTNYAKVESYVKTKRPPKEIRHQLDLGFKFERNTFEIFEIRPEWNSPDQNDYQKSSFVKFRYVKSRRIWKLYWMRASGKWELYEPFPQSNSLDKIIDCIDADVYGCFYG
jgi:hypothetical protein